MIEQAKIISNGVEFPCIYKRTGLHRAIVSYKAKVGFDIAITIKPADNNIRIFVNGNEVKFKSLTFDDYSEFNGTMTERLVVDL